MSMNNQVSPSGVGTSGVASVSGSSLLPNETLQFEIDLSQLVPSGDVDTIEAIQVNFLTMNNTNTSGGGRLWDALGNSNNPGEINSYFTFQPLSAFTYTNANSGNIEVLGDVADPDLDIVDWSIEVRLP